MEPWQVAYSRWLGTRSERDFERFLGSIIVVAGVNVTVMECSFGYARAHIKECARSLVGYLEPQEIAFVVLESIWERRPAINGLSSFLFTGIRNQVITARRLASRTYPLELAAIVVGPEAIDAERVRSPQTKILLDRLRDAVDQLTPRLREIAQHLFYNGESVLHVAQELGVRPNTIRVNKRRIIKELRVRLGLAPKPVKTPKEPNPFS